MTIAMGPSAAFQQSLIELQAASANGRVDLIKCDGRIGEVRIFEQYLGSLLVEAADSPNPIPTIDALLERAESLGVDSKKHFDFHVVTAALSSSEFQTVLPHIVARASKAGVLIPDFLSSHEAVVVASYTQAAEARVGFFFKILASTESVTPEAYQAVVDRALASPELLRQRRQLIHEFSDRNASEFQKTL